MPSFDQRNDRFIELRAQLALEPEMPIALAMESAAGLNRLAQRAPEQEVVWLPARRELPKALRGFRVVHVDLPVEAIDRVGGLPVWRVEALLVGVATKPSSYRDLAGLAQWLPDSGTRVNDQLLLACLRNANMASSFATMALDRPPGWSDSPGAPLGRRQELVRMTSRWVVRVIAT